MTILRQSTSQTIRFGPFLDNTDGFTPETALIITQANMRLSKDGNGFASKNAAGNATHDSNGWYFTTLDATDTNTVGEFIIEVTVAGALPVWKDKYFVVPAATYDAMTGGLNNFDPAADTVANVTTVATTTANTDMRGTDNAALATDLAVVDGTVDAILVDTGTDLPAQIAALNNFDPSTDTVATVGTVTDGAKATDLAIVDANVDAILVDTSTTIPAQITALNNLSEAQVNAQVLDVLTVDTFPEITSIPLATSTILEKINFMYAMNRNRLRITETTISLINDTDTGTIGTAAQSDDTITYERGEFG